MLKRLSTVLVLAVFAAGCGVKAQTYVMDRERVDQGQSGNGGCLSGNCPQGPQPEKKTRKTYVLELTKPLPESEVRRIEEETRTTVTSEPQQDLSPQAAPAEPHDNGPKPIVIPRIDDEPSTVSAPTSSKPKGPTEAQSYTVQKDDTLQKISKKFYGSVKYWTKIYEANKEKIKNPNFVRPGTVLTIPAV